MDILLIGHGYTGAYLARHLIARGHTLGIVDAAPRAVPEGASVHTRRYQDLPSDLLASVDAILWFAGHSSVGQSVSDPQGALGNNCMDLLDLARRKPSATPLIYASTASLYSVRHRDDGRPPPTLDEGETRLSPSNPYDATKAAFDALAGCYAEGLTGLRMGTVSGFGPVLRPELIFNAMNISALRDGAVKVANPTAWRSLLFLDDLARIVTVLLEGEAPRPPIVNAASISLSIGDLGAAIAGFHGVPVVALPDSPTYSFRVSCVLAERLAGGLAQMPLTDRCAAFAAAWQGAEDGALVGA